jgi:hypothetical protein
VKKVAAAVAACVAVLGFGVACASADNVVFGVNDNAGLYGNTQFWSLLKGENMSVNTIILRWDETTSNGFQNADGAFLPKAVAAAAAAGVQLEFAVSPAHSAELSDQGGPAKFAAWLTTLAKTYPQVTRYVVMNECNQDLFVNPQFQNGQNISAAECGAFLAAGYDALKAVNPNIFVWGLGLSPRGNVPDGSAKPSTDPIDWLGYLGQWYRQSGRTKPLMDGLDLHPYPIPQSLPFATGYADPHNYSVSNLPRVYQAFYNAFNGTGQPTVGPGSLPVQLNEVGIQTDTTGHSGYTNQEATNGTGVVPPTNTEQYQAQWYSQLVDYAECHAEITNVNIFKLIDETDLRYWQSGLYFADGAAKQSAAAVASEIQKDAGRCPTGAATTWAPGGTTAGGTTGGTTTTLSTSVTGNLAAMASGTPILSFTLTSGIVALTGLTATSNVSFTLAASPTSTQVGAPRRPASAARVNKPKPPKPPKPKPTKAKPATATQKVLLTKAYRKGQKISATVGVKGLKDGTYKLVFTLTAKNGSAKATITSTPFTIKNHKVVSSS